ncbi:hypothetical protein IJT93_12835 [bacterium]|nr:hypothetical protein [bacterium]
MFCLKTAVLTSLCLLCALQNPVCADIQPKAFDWQARLRRVIPERERALCLETAVTCKGQSVEAMCAEIEAMDTNLPKEPLKLYTAINILIQKDRDISALKKNLQAVRKGRELLQNYRYALKHARRIKTAKDKLHLQVPERQRSIPANIVSEEGADVLRFLPAPQKTWTDDTARQFLRAADSDLKFLEAQEEKLSAELKESEQDCSPWHRFVAQTGKKLNPDTCLPKERTNTAGKSLQEFIDPAPPFDLKPLQPEGASSRN